MALAAAVGKGEKELVSIGKTFPLVREEDVSVVGFRTSNLDPPELRALQGARLNLYAVDALRRDGITTSLHEAVESLPKPLYLHLDIDVIGSTEMPALAGMHAGVHSPGGLALREANSLCEALAGLPLAGLDITLYDPDLDPQRSHAKEIVELIGRILA
jgi:arginase